MSAIQTLIASIRGKGVGVALDGEGIRLEGALASCAAETAELKARKPEAIAWLRAEHGPGQAIIDLAGDSAFAPVGAGGFAALVDADRYLSRSPLFDRMIGASEDHFWDPRDARYLDFSDPFDPRTQAMAPEDCFPWLQAKSVREKLSADDRRAFVNKVIWLRFSMLLHGEQGALNLAASLCSVLKDPAAQEFAANQVREEARHVAGFALYIEKRWGRAAPCVPALRHFLVEIITADDVSKKIVGMQIMVEGLAMGVLGALHRHLLDPVGRRLTQLVMTDEAFHHKFGKVWAEKIVPQASPAERQRLEAWTSHCLQAFILKMNPPFELQVLKKDFGLDPLVVAQEVQALGFAQHSFGAAETFQVLSRTLMKAGLLSREAAAIFGAFMDAGQAAISEAWEESVVSDGLAYLRSVNERAATADAAVA